MLEFIKSEIEEYEEFIKNTEKISNDLKKEGSTIDEQHCITDYQNLVLRRSEKNYVGVVRILGEILEKIEKKKEFLENASNEDRARIQDSIQMYQQNINATIDAVSKKIQEVFIVAYQLKIYDAQKQTDNCKTILLSNEYAAKIPYTVKKIIASNIYDLNDERIIVRNGVKFTLQIGTNFGHKLSYEKSENSSFDPFVVAGNPNKQISDNNFVNVFRKVFTEKYAQGLDDVHFVLTKYGVNMVAANRMLIKKNWIQSNDF